MVTPVLSMYSRVVKSARESSELFLSSLALRYSRGTMLISLIIFLITFAIFIYLSPDALPNGDAALYAQQVIHRDFSRTTIHLGYYLLGFVFTALLPLSIDYALNLMNCFFGALSVALIYLITFTISKKNLVSFISSLFLATNFIFIFNSLYAEVYISQTFFLLLAIQLWLWNKPYLTSLAFTLSFLIAPSTIFALPFFIVLRPRIQSLLRFAIIVFLISTIVLFPHINDYLFGGRGLLGAAKRELIIEEALYKESWEFFWGLYLYIPFVLAGIIQIITQKKLHVLGLGIFSLWLISFIFGETTGDVPVQLPTYALLCLVGGLGFDILFHISPTENSSKYVWVPPGVSLVIVVALALATRGTQAQLSLKIILAFIFATILYALAAIIFQRVNLSIKSRVFIISGILVLLVSLNSFLMLRLITKTSNNFVEYRNTIVEMNQTADIDYIVIGEFSEGVLFEHYIFQSYLTGRWINTEWLFGIGSWGKENQVRAIEEWQNAIKTNREIWLLTDDYPTLFSDLKQAGYSIETFRSIYRARPQN